MTSLHASLAAALAPALPEQWNVRPWPAIAPENIPAGQMVLQIWTEERSTGSIPIEWDNTLTLRLMTGSSPSQSSDASLASALETLLDACYNAARADTWDKITARAAVFPNAAGTPTYPGWDITVTLTTPNYR